MPKDRARDVPRGAPTPGAPTAVAHQKRGGAGAGAHRDKKRDEELVPRKRKHKGRGLEPDPQ